MGHPARVRAHAEGNADPYGMTNKKGEGKDEGKGACRRKCRSLRDDKQKKTNAVPDGMTNKKGKGEGRWVGVAMRGEAWLA